MDAKLIVTRNAWVPIRVVRSGLSPWRRNSGINATSPKRLRKNTIMNVSTSPLICLIDVCMPEKARVETTIRAIPRNRP